MKGEHHALAHHGDRSRGPEGASVTLVVDASTPPSSTTMVRYPLVTDEGSATADADEAGYVDQENGSLQFSSKTPSATIEVAI